MSEKTESADKSSSTDGRWPKLAVKNFGPIAEGEVELRPLTVFAGPSNTGKSWLATLIYALGRHVSGGSGFRGIPIGLIDPYKDVLKNFPENPAAWLQSLRKDKVLRLTDGEKQTLKSILESGKGALGAELLRCFGLAKARHLAREGNTEATSVTFMNVSQPHPFTTRQRLTICGDEGFSLGVDFMTDECRPPSTNRFLAILEQLLQVADSDNERYERHLNYLRAELFDFLVSGDHRRHSSTYYLPADRGGVMHAHRVVVGALIQSASRAGLTHRSPLPTLSGILGDFLEQLVELADQVPGLQDPITEPANSLEQNVLGGKIRVERSGVDYPYFTYRPDGWERNLSLMSVSSMVSELAPVALYLRHCVDRGDLLILEEPEAHLHPAMQVRLVREIAGWIKHGIRVLITTHSEWVLEEIANIVAAGEGEKEDGLKKQDVGMWLFEPKGKRSPGSNIREIEWSVDDGGFALDFDDVAKGLHNDWADLVGDINE